MTSKISVSDNKKYIDQESMKQHRLKYKPLKTPKKSPLKSCKTNLFQVFGGSGENDC